MPRPGGCFLVCHCVQVSALASAARPPLSLVQLVGCSPLLGRDAVVATRASRCFVVNFWPAHKPLPSGAPGLHLIDAK